MPTSKNLVPFYPIPRLRIGSLFTSRLGIQYRVLEAIVRVSVDGFESPSVSVERLKGGELKNFG